ERQEPAQVDPRAGRADGADQQQQRKQRVATDRQPPTHALHTRRGAVLSLARRERSGSGGRRGGLGPGDMARLVRPQVTSIHVPSVPHPGSQGTHEEVSPAGALGHQIRSPTSAKIAGTSTARTSSVSSSTPTPTMRPSCPRVTSGSTPSAAKTPA